MLWWIVAALCAFFIKGLCGFANTLVFTTILSFGNDNINISPVELLVGYPTNIIIAWKERKAIKTSVWLPLSALVIVGSLIGMLFLKNADATLIKIIFGFVIILVGAEMLLSELRPRAHMRSKVALTVVGILSGLLCGLYGVGALLGAYVGKAVDDTHAFKANLCVVFMVESTFRLILYAAWGIITLDAIKRAAMLYPVMLLGLALGIASGRLLNERIVKKLVIVMLIVSGVALVVSNLA